MDQPNAPPRTRLLWRGLGWVAAVGASLLVFGWYTDPDFVRDVADRVWACF